MNFEEVDENVAENYDYGEILDTATRYKIYASNDFLSITK